MPTGKIKKCPKGETDGIIRIPNEEFKFRINDVDDSIKDKLTDGLEVEFNIRWDGHNRYAKNVKSASKPPSPQTFIQKDFKASTSKKPETNIDENRKFDNESPTPKNKDSNLLDIPLPKTVRGAFTKIKPVKRHPGLMLDKFHNQFINGEQQKDELKKVIACSGANDILEQVKARHKAAVEVLNGIHWPRRTVTPLTLHLARAATLENAGLCLHPIYGFAYLPGSGLKGLTRAYAETVWLPSQTGMSGKDAWELIEDVFGWADNPVRKEQIKAQEHPAHKRFKPTESEDAEKNKTLEIGESAVGVIFHDALPEGWPKLTLDIVTCHHQDYYNSKDRRDFRDAYNAPGDWQTPVPVSFLAVETGTKFRFALSPRASHIKPELVEQARQWLDAALTYNGAGAKTNAGYGYFERESTTSLYISKRHLIATAELTLVTPGFFAGADPYGSTADKECDLRPATLRGHLRWWWRTMHAGFLSPYELSRLEAAIWGDTDSGGAVALKITPLEKPDFKKPERYDKETIRNSARLDRSYITDRKTSQGLFYASYGMDEQQGQGRRYYLPAGARWNIQFIARGTKYNDSELSSETVLRQTLYALWLLCNLGAVGSKSRHGFGSLQFTGFKIENASIPSIPDYLVRSVTDTAQGLLYIQGNSNIRSNDNSSAKFKKEWFHTSSLWKNIVETVSRANINNIWTVMDSIGRVRQSFAKRYKHNETKKALGLPRRINGRNIVIRVGDKSGIDRHASPVHTHVHSDNGKYLVRFIAFTAPYLPDAMESRDFLEKYLQSVKREF